MNPFRDLLEGARRAGKDATPEQKDAVRAATEMSRRKLRRALVDLTPAERKRDAALLPSAREVFAVRVVDAEGRTQPWPACETRDDANALVLRRLRQKGLR